mmetsp:Transcript_1060/g.2730  ORF Transcript_1060/g.2730 Transcript_1060/m.2730 type:complete len:93 (+) Transcript_1060:285-563(+)
MQILLEKDPGMEAYVGQSFPFFELTIEMAFLRNNVIYGVSSLAGERLILLSLLVNACLELWWHRRVLCRRSFLDQNHLCGVGLERKIIYLVS